VHDDRLSDQPRVSAEPALPQREADDRDSAAARLIVRGTEEPSGCGRNIEQREKVSSDSRGYQSFRLLFAGEVENLKVIRADVAEDFLFVPPFKEVRSRDRSALDRRLHAMNVHEFFGIAIGKRAKQDAVDHAED